MQLPSPLFLSAGRPASGTTGVPHGTTGTGGASSPAHASPDGAFWGVPARAGTPGWRPSWRRSASSRRASAGTKRACPRSCWSCSSRCRRWRACPSCASARPRCPTRASALSRSCSPPPGMRSTSRRRSCRGRPRRGASATPSSRHRPAWTTSPRQRSARPNQSQLPQDTCLVCLVLWLCDT